jgi:hypothetical protein
MQRLFFFFFGKEAWQVPFGKKDQEEGRNGVSEGCGSDLARVILLVTLVASCAEGNLTWRKGCCVVEEREGSQGQREICPRLSGERK